MVFLGRVWRKRVYDAILIKKKDSNATFASVLMLMKDKVDKEQVAENVNKIRQTKTRDVLV